MLNGPALGPKHTLDDESVSTFSEPHPGQCKQNQEETKTDYLPRMHSPKVLPPHKKNKNKKTTKQQKTKQKQGSACNFRISV